MGKKAQQAGTSLWGAEIPLVDYQPYVPKRRYLPMVEADELSELAKKLVPGFEYQPEPEPCEVVVYAQGTYCEKYEGYEILYLTPASNVWAAQGLEAKHIVSLSGGLGSAIAAERAIQRYGRENVIIWFADVKKENRDLYRFLHDLMRRFGGRLYYYVDGRRPEDVWDQKKLIPNNRIAPCSFLLKVHPFRNFVLAMAALPTIYIGYKLGEDDRMCDTSASYHEAIPEASVDYPLLWRPAEVRDLVTVCEHDLGIIVPLLYRLGYDYNNCGGECCRAGQTSWIRTYECFPQRFFHMADWEDDARSQGDARASYTMCSRERNKQKESLPLSTIAAEHSAERAAKLYSREATTRRNKAERLLLRYSE